MEKSFLKALDDFFTMEFFKKEYFQNNFDIRGEDWYDVLHLSFAAEFNFIDLASFLGIQLDEKHLEVPGLHEYQQKYFSSDYDLDHLEKVSENNHDLYDVWYERWLEARKKGETDIETPEIKVTYDYIIRCFELYREMFERVEFQTYLTSISPQLKEDIEGIFKKQDTLSQFYKLEGNLTYFTFIKSDILLRQLLTITYSQSRDAKNYMSSNLESKLAKDVYDKVNDFFVQGIFLVPHVGALHNVSLLMSLNTPNLYGTDICISAVPFDDRDLHLMDRLSHDCTHIDTIHDGINKHYQIQDRHFLHAAFKEFLKLLRSAFFEDLTYQTIIKNIVKLHHETGQPIGLDDEFMDDVIYIFLGKDKINGTLKFLIPREAQKVLGQEWKDVWIKLSTEYQYTHIDAYDLAAATH